jgi:DNA polymerase-3 subunit epsilon
MNWIGKLFGRQDKGPAVPLAADRQAALDAWRQLPPADMTRSHYRSRYAVVDVEASGLNMKQDRLISIGALAVVDGIIDFHDAFEVVLRQDTVSTDANILIHGIGGSAQREGTEPADALLAFLAWLGKSPLVAYHALFDQTMIDRALKEYLGIELELPWIDLAWVMPDLFRDLNNNQSGLDDWLTIFGIDSIQRHNAVSDAYATARLLQVALARGLQREAETPASFVELERARRWMRRGG